MSSVGVFRKVEKDGKPFFVYTLTQTNNPTSSSEAAIDSGGNTLPLQPLFFCPRARIKFLKPRLKIDDDDDDGDGDGDGDGYLPLNSSPHFPNKRIVYQQDESLLDCNRQQICKLPVVPILWCNNEEPDCEQFECGACQSSRFSTSYYAYLKCEKVFHKECVESPLKIRHPSHPFHSLQLYSHYPFFVDCICCDETGTPADGIAMSYHCVTCDWIMHPICSMKPVPIVIDHPKSHPHPLNFFPRQASLACNICGLIKKFHPTYICVQCVFVAHRDCIGFPHVIRISRHHHRISFISSLPSGIWSCRVCRQKVDNNYGAYSCNKCDAYFVHSGCALHKKVWDGKDLNGVSEEDDIIDDGEPFKRIDDGIILHPSHSHHMRLEISRVYDENNSCRGCTFPIYEGKFYSCMECNFILHEICAHAPRMKRHPFFPHPLRLNFGTKGYGSGELVGLAYCRACSFPGNGFAYESADHSSGFTLDLTCASITEPFEYPGHQHPLFIAWYPDPKPVRCQLCKHKSYYPKLDCMECEYIICTKCATLPYKVRYKHDSHFLTICDGKEATDQPDWCEICESKIEVQEEEDELREVSLIESQRFYECSDCCTTLHVRCLLGKNIYLTPDKTLRFKRAKYQIILNSFPSRPFCSGCQRRCPLRMVFKGFDTTFCSLECIPNRVWW
ncbi:hypothetical protein EUTSA_v10000071mg [Eutrema salsugineum]|uniref:Zinc finger PHD-type domain-containing protein n=1 Tax=Eutrema salsugineum TaxID=72664 RepID=V4M251_EUTSA|nr:uncharacterized protein LOC18021890 [Eutrema salsugineum]ESQ46298.1 hypothetical protein EUTSA_v10000071mg [Eutrema salsugineum]